MLGPFVKKTTETSIIILLGRGRGVSDFVFVTLAFFFEACDFGNELALECFAFLIRSLSDLVFEEDFLFSNLGVDRNVDLRNLLLLLKGEMNDWRGFLKSAHGEFVGRFHKANVTNSPHSTQINCEDGLQGVYWMAMSHLRLLSTDFDGTLISHFSDGRCAPDFANVLVEHKKSGGLWAVNTGRGLEHAIEGVGKFQPPVQPDFLLTNEREIFHRTPDGRWVPEHAWNEACYKKHDDLFAQSIDIFDRIRNLTEGHPGINLLEENGKPAGVITSDENLMHEFVAFLESECQSMPTFSYQRNTIYLRFAHSDYDKGTALGELCRILQISPLDVLAAGDHFNDISMLDGRYAAHPCCPSNAIPEVCSIVQAAGGYLASKPAAEGVAEAWHFFYSDRQK